MSKKTAVHNKEFSTQTSPSQDGGGPGSHPAPIPSDVGLLCPTTLDQSQKTTPPSIRASFCLNSSTSPLLNSSSFSSCSNGHTFPSPSSPSSLWNIHRRILLILYPSLHMLPIPIPGPCNLPPPQDLRMVFRTAELLSTGLGPSPRSYKEADTSREAESVI